MAAVGQPLRDRTEVFTSLCEHFSRHIVLLVHPHKLFAEISPEPLSPLDGKQPKQLRRARIRMKP